MARLNANAETLLANTTVDLNSAAPQPLYVIPSIVVSCYVTKIVITGANAAWTTASLSCGYGGATYNDVIATAVHTELSATDYLYSVVNAKAGAVAGSGGNILNALAGILEGSALSVNVFVFGFLTY